MWVFTNIYLRLLTSQRKIIIMSGGVYNICRNKTYDNNTKRRKGINEIMLFKVLTII